ncbi:MAG: uracil-DNA glycosylase [Pyrinomonadaceae bacterium]
MNDSNHRENLADLLTDLKEEILYLREIGVENLDADLPDIFPTPTRDLQIESTKTEIPRERLEKFVPAEDIVKSIAQKAPPTETEPPRASKQSILEQTKLSKLGDLPKRNTFNFPANKIQDPIKEEKPMPAKTTEEIPSLFGDMSRQLPESGETVEAIRAEIGDCTRCPLHQGRTKIVHSTGNREAQLMFVGEAPGADEDAQGEPFVGRAGQLLNKIIEAIGMKREDVFIGNINRCRPPGNRQPTAEESATCKPFLLREIAVVRPKVIVVLGNTATQNLLDTKVGITKLRGNFQDYFGVKVMPTFHPAYLLRDPRKKREVWEDMKKVRDELEKT